MNSQYLAEYLICPNVQDYYSVLGVSRNSTKSEIKSGIFLQSLSFLNNMIVPPSSSIDSWYFKFIFIYLLVVEFMNDHVLVKKWSLSVLRKINY